MNDIQKRALQYIENTGGEISVAAFDDDHEPIGPLLRQDLVPKFAAEVNGKLSLTVEGHQAIV